MFLHAHSAGDGVFATTIDGKITLVDLKSNSTRDLVTMSDIKDVCILSAPTHLVFTL